MQWSGRLAESYQAKPEKVAAEALLQQALVQADDGSWERIAVGRVYYLGGMKDKGQAIFDAVLSDKPDPSDLFRVARVYREAGEWPRAKALVDQSIQLNPKDEKGLAEVGGYYLMNGDRETAEALFARSFALETELWATLSAAGAYLGVDTQL
ncbi:MAG TPA: hypothetical protein VK827_04165 [Lysobacter sp.]|nr:hypothetical protein [Lysobacter sp.]